MKRLVRGLLAEPSSRSRDPSLNPSMADRGRLLRDKAFLNRLYREWYGTLAAAIPPGPEPVVELGAGGGFMAEHVPGLLSSDLRPGGGVDLAAEAQGLPFADGALRGLVMVNVFHHLGRPSAFLDEAARCVAPRGVLAMIEPWVSPWSRLVYRTMHHEPFVPDAEDWDSAVTDPMAGANGALPWIVFARDRERLARDHPGWVLRELRPGWPLRYLLSGGISTRALAPAWTFAAWRSLERLLSGVSSRTAMFALVVLERRPRT